MKWLTVKPLLWLSGGLLATVLALSGALWAQGKTHAATFARCERDRDKAQTQLDAASSALEAAVQTNARQHAAVEDLADKLDVAIRETERLDALLTEAETRADENGRERDRALAALQADRGNTYARDASCGAWGAAAVCGGITDSLQEQWRDAARRR